MMKRILRLTAFLLGLTLLLSACGNTANKELVDASTNEVLVRLTHEKRAGTGMFGGNYTDVMARSVKEVASDVAKALAAF